MPRSDPAGSRLTSPWRTPRLVIAIMFPVGSIYLTNRSAPTAIINVPGNVVHGCISQCDSISHELHPDEARTTISSFSFSAVDLAGALSDELRTQLFSEQQGPRENEVRVFSGDTDDFLDGTWSRIATYVLDGVVENDAGLYSFQASDRQREMRTEIFNLKVTRLAESIDDIQTTITVRSTDGFERIQHVGAFTDAPLQYVGYLFVKKTREIIRYTDLNATQFLGCVRAINSVASALEISGTDEDQWPEIVEFPYLEMSGPSLAWTLLTGELLSTGYFVPDGWNCGIAIADVDINSFINIGTDLHDPDNPSGGLIMRFIHLSQTDGKRFIEEQVLQPCGCYLTITPEGKLSLRRVSTVLANASYVRAIDEADVVSHGALQHDQDALINQLIIDYNWDGEEYTRRFAFINNSSVGAHGIGSARTLELKGLPVTQQSARAARRLWQSLSSRYGSPPLRMSVQLLPQHNDLQVGDVIFLTLTDLEDYAAETAGVLARAWEIQRQTMNWISGELTLDLFASSQFTQPNAPEGDTTPIDDAWYESEGTALSSVATISGGVLTANYTALGDADVRAPGAIYYYGGNLTINDGVTLSLSQNVQLRILGNLQLNGTISGVGTGAAAIATPHVVSVNYTAPDPMFTDVQTYGSTQGSGGLYFHGALGPGGLTNPDPRFATFFRLIGPALHGHAAVPEFNVKVEGGNLIDLPSELRGTPGIYGAPYYLVNASTNPVEALGGAGGAGGAGLLIVCRGLSFGINGKIDLSGSTGSASSSFAVGTGSVYPGAGGGGAPGGLLIIIDGEDAPYPDLSGGNFVANHGSTPQLGIPIDVLPPAEATTEAITGNDPGISVGDHWDAHSTVLFLEPEVGLGEGVDELPPRPQIIDTVPTDYGIELFLAVLPEAEYDRIEIWASIDNDLQNAIMAVTGRGQHFRVPIEQIKTRYYWARSIQGARKSEWSSDPTAGLLATGGAPYREVAHWLETFDSYASQADFEREWEIVSGTPIIAFGGGGINGGKVMRVYGAMRARYRRLIPYDPNAVYECATRFQSVGVEAGNNKLSLGFFGATTAYDIDAFGNTFVFIGSGWSTPNRTLLNQCDLSVVGIADYQRAIAWITGSLTTQISSSPLQVPFDQLIAPWRPSQIFAVTANGEKASYIRPTIECNQPAGSPAAACQIDYIEVRKLENSDVGLSELADGTMSTADDNEYWTAPGFAWDATLLVGQGLNSGNELKFQVAGTVPNNQIVAISRGAMKLANNVTIAIHYRIGSVTSIGSNVKFAALLQGIVKSGEMPRHHVPVSSGVVEEVAVNTLTADGTTYIVTFTFTNLFTEAALISSDYMRLHLMITAPEASDGFDFRVQRIRMVRS